MRNGADFSVKRNFGNNLLHIAIKWDKTDVAKLLLEEHPQLANEKDTESNSPLWLFKNKLQCNCICRIACDKRNTEMIEHLIQIGCDVNFQCGQSN